MRRAAITWATSATANVGLAWSTSLSAHRDRRAKAVLVLALILVPSRSSLSPTRSMLGPWGASCTVASCIDVNINARAIARAHCRVFDSEKLGG